MLSTERNHRGGAAMGCGDGGRVEIIGGHHAHGGELLDMAVAVDAAGKHQLAAGVDDAPGVETGTDLGDALAGDTHVGAKRLLRSGDRAATDHEIEAHARIFLYSECDRVAGRGHEGTAYRRGLDAVRTALQGRRRGVARCTAATEDGPSGRAQDFSGAASQSRLAKAGAVGFFPLDAPRGGR